MYLLPFFPRLGNVYELFFQILLTVLDVSKMLWHCTRIMAHFEKWILAILETVCYWSSHWSMKILLGSVTSLVFCKCLGRKL